MLLVGAKSQGGQKIVRIVVEQGIIEGPRLVVTTRAIVMRGSYAPSGFAPEVEVPQGAEEAAGPEELSRVVRDQIRKGADWIKIHATGSMSASSSDAART